MRANIAVKAIDRRTARPIPGVNIELGAATYSLNQVTDPTGAASFTIDVGGGEAGRHPEEGVAILLTAYKPGYGMKRDRFIAYGNRAVIFQMERK